ncbi:Aste57867_20341 [Aphanomyces stellatus]|uniref:chitin synthase n=1 Tax=Aphanomyces stellatus TaxID=120398 RepID=A0A485LFG0_9STRA|nr:hypothetical protein As57867_020275 [Aphanomyces stellatus]VFT97028.1 Aste57867_20341 [Aphanomyces stellatus]
MSRRNYASRGGASGAGNNNGNAPLLRQGSSQGSQQSMGAQHRSGGQPPRNNFRPEPTYSRDSEEEFAHQNNAVLGVPVWQDSSADVQNGSYFEAGTPQRSHDNRGAPARFGQSGSSRSNNNIQPQQQAYRGPHMVNDMANPHMVMEDVHRQRQSNAMAVNAVPATTEEAFRLIGVGVTAETEERYESAVRNFLDGGEMLCVVHERETDMHVRSLLNQKATQVIAWAEGLNRWLEGGRVGACPRRDSFKVGVDMVNRLGTCAGPVSATMPEELRTMYYTPCANKVVSDFTADGYRLHAIEQGRSPQLMVVITMYNEDEAEMYSTLKKVANNIEHIKSKKLPGYEGDESWKNILVCVVSDGRTKANKGTLTFLRDVGVFDDDAMNIMMVGVDVQCHLFEFCVQMKKGDTIAESVMSKHLYPPTQVIFALKEHNAGKLNSHEWYFNAFAEQVQPEYTVLLDVGTMPTAKAFYLLLAAMELDPQIGGTCGEIAVDKPIPHLCNWVIAAQHFEYKISNIMDKSLESVFGFISVLPGAFSAYRYKAIRGAPLQAYFKSLTTPMHELGAFQGNMYLAEDRILCFELLARRGQRWTMQYVKDAIARTDVPTDLTSLIGQRRRWLNGSFFALVYTILNWGRVYTESDHSYIRKFFLCFQYAYMTANVALSWILPANFFLVTYFLVIVGFQNDNWGYIPTKGIPQATKNICIQVFSLAYGVSFLVQLVAGLGNKPKHVKNLYRITAIFYGLVMTLTTVIAVGFILKPIIDELKKGVNLKKLQDILQNFNLTDAAAFVASAGVFFLASALHCELHHIALTFVQYMALLPTFVNILNTYSFCNLHDLSWGTKGLESSEGHGPKAGSGKGNFKDAVEKKKAEEARKAKEAKIKDEMEGSFARFRSTLLIFWLMSNLGFAYTVIVVDVNEDGQQGVNYLKFLFYTVAIFNLIRLVGSILFLFMNFKLSLFRCCIRGTMEERIRAKNKRRGTQNIAPPGQMV